MNTSRNAVLGTAALVCLALLGGCRGGISKKPPIHPVLDMDFQQKLKAQSYSEFEGWDDHRGMRRPVDGTLARGGIVAGAERGDYYVPTTEQILASYDRDGSKTIDPVEAKSLVFGSRHAFSVADRNDDDVLDAAEIGAATKLYRYRNGDAYVTENPLPVTREVLERGRERFQIYCATCHGRSAKGGIVAKRWPAPVPDLVEHPDEATRARLIGLPFGELFETITRGKATMPGYGSQIHVEDRWAIAHYLKALQQHFN